MHLWLVIKLDGLIMMVKKIKNQDIQIGIKEKLN